MMLKCLGMILISYHPQLLLLEFSTGRDIEPVRAFMETKNYSLWLEPCCQDMFFHKNNAVLPSVRKIRYARVNARGEFIERMAVMDKAYHRECVINSQAGDSMYAGRADNFNPGS